MNTETQKKIYNNEIVKYPPAPWHLEGEMWAGIYKMDEPVKLPIELIPVFSPFWQVVILVRYTKGILHYDEFVLGSLVRYGFWHWGIYVNHIWVNNAESLWGGRYIWGLPKELAEFSWNKNEVRITTEKGLLSDISFENVRAGAWRQQIPARGFGFLDDEILYSSTSFHANVGRTKIIIQDFGSVFPYQPAKRISNGFALRSFKVDMPAPIVLNTPSITRKY